MRSIWSRPATASPKPGITHYLFDYSPDMEYLEVVAPANFQTLDVEGPCPVPAPTPWTKIA